MNAKILALSLISLAACGVPLEPAQPTPDAGTVQAAPDAGPRPETWTAYEPGGATSFPQYAQPVSFGAMHAVQSGTAWRLEIEVVQEGVQDHDPSDQFLVEAFDRESGAILCATWLPCGAPSGAYGSSDPCLGGGGFAAGDRIDFQVDRARACKMLPALNATLTLAYDAP